MVVVEWTLWLNCRSTWWWLWLWLALLMLAKRIRFWHHYACERLADEESERHTETSGRCETRADVHMRLPMASTALPLCLSDCWERKVSNEKLGVSLVRGFHFCQRQHFTKVLFYIGFIQSQCKDLYFALRLHKCRFWCILINPFARSSLLARKLFYTIISNSGQ